MASQLVFDAYELVENILLRLPLRDILLASQVNLQCQHVTQRSEDVRNKLFDDEMPVEQAVLDQIPKKPHLARYNVSKNPKHCWWFIRFHLTTNANKCVFLLRERKRVFWFSGSKDGSKSWYRLNKGQLKIERYHWAQDNFTVAWRHENGSEVWRATVDDSHPLMEYMEAFHADDIAAVWNGPLSRD